MEHIKSKIRTIPHWPKQGVMFRDITTLLKDAQGLKDVIKEFVERYKDAKIDFVAGIESRGFIFGGAIAHQLGVGFVPIRKKGKLPPEVETLTYDTEYSTDTIEMNKDAIKKGDNVLLVDDLIATGGTALAACQLIEKLGGNIVECAFIVDLPELKGKNKLLENNYKVFNLVEFEGE
ncbi:adenine phosphoribosyltransferase [Candidatus Woesearchaeota archaeon]|nr:adenine phosphoribosyltransferase [Candidatus Woesearchaeota archaeon]